MKSRKESGGPEYRCDETGCFYDESDERVIQGYKNAVAAQLGMISKVDLPKEVERHYEYLMSSFEVTYIGPGVEARRKGVPLGPDVIGLIRKVEDLNVPVAMCRGCTVSSGLTAKDALRTVNGVQ